MSFKERLLTWFRKPDIKIFSALSLGILVYYASLIRVQFTFGDGPELLTAMYRLGGPHPSGYPLFTLLGFIPARIGIPSPWWLASFVTAAIPGALAVGFLYLLMRETKVTRPVSVLGALAYGLNTHIVYQATRVEVYALHCFLGAVALWAIAVFLRPKREEIEGEKELGGDLRYAYIATLFTCLAVTNHLTAAFLIVPITAGMLMGNFKALIKPKTILILLGISLACASIYLYLPWQAMANHGDRISWNDPQTLDLFWFHVSGKEYSIFRSDQTLTKAFNAGVKGLNKLHNSLNNTFFPGVLAVVILGLFDVFLKRSRVLIVIVLFTVSTMGYIATYEINDISTYYSLIFLVAMLLFGNGVSWLISVRFKDEEKSTKLMVLRVVAIGLSVAWILGLSWNSRRNGYKEAVAQEMSEAIMKDMKDPAIIFTSVDGHTFPMWYQAYLEHPERKVIPVDAVMFNLKNKQWYRNFFFDNFKEINWPPNDVAMGSGWREYLIEHNPEVNFYVLSSNPWRHKGSWAENVGWHSRIHRGKPKKTTDASVYAKHIYVAREKKFGNSKYFYDTHRVYTQGEGKIACVAEWTKHNGIKGFWRFKGPKGELHEFKNHDIPAGSNQSWEYLETDQQTPGKWRCEVETSGEKLLVAEFEISAKK